MNHLFRLVRRHVLFAAINLIGLAIGIAGFLVVALYVKDQFSYDRHFTGADRIYRLANTITMPGRPPLVTSSATPKAGHMLAAEMPEVEAVTRLARRQETLGAGPDRQVGAAVLWADPNLLQVLDFPLARGDAASALSRPDGMVLTPALAGQLFGDADPMGRTVELPGGATATVTGVLGPLGRSHLDFAAIIADAARGASAFDRAPAESWSMGGAVTFLRLAPGTAAKVEAALPDFLARNAVGLPPPEMFPDFLRLRLDPLTSIHLRIAAVDEATRGARLPVLHTLVAVAVLILGIAIVNYTNLATAQAVQRAREVGVRKVVGAKRRDLVLLFLGESVAMTMASTLLALALVEMLSPLFTRLVGQEVSLWQSMDLPLIAVILGTPLCVGVLGGLYPALLLSGYRPATALKGGVHGPGGSRLRSALVVMQFAASIALVIGTLTIQAQLRHARTAELGYSPESLVFAGILDEDPVRQRELRSRLEAHPGITAVTFSSIVPADRSESLSSVQLLGKAYPGGPPVLSSHAVTTDFFATYGIGLIAGPGLPPGWQPTPVLKPDGTPAMTAGRYAYVSRAALARLDIASPEEAIGVQVNAAPDGAQFPTEIVGVVEDVRLRSARDAVEPILFQFTDAAAYVSVRLAAGDPRPALTFLDQQLDELFPDRGIKRRHFVDERLDAQYAAEQQQAQVFATFAVLAILLANMGLFGLTALAATRRTKEIGIRRVVGASTGQLVLLLSGSFTRPVLVANLIAWPVAWLMLSHWLEQFAVRITVGPLPFLLAGAAALLIAVSTVSVHAARIALMPPARSLRYE